MKTVFQIIALLFFSVAVNGAVGLSIPYREYNALFDLYNSTQGEFWSWREITAFGSPWDFENTSSDPCINQWQGLTCSSTIGSIVEIDLADYNLNGTLPGTIGDFSHLRSLSLSNNSIHSFIPDTIGNATQINHLDLSYNTLSGQMPCSISTLCQLQYFSLYSNWLDHTIPDMFGCMKDLVDINFGYNRLTSTLPSSIYTLQKLTSLSLNSNHLTGPVFSKFGNITALVHCDLFQNNFTGPISNDIESLSNLQWLYMSDNAITGRIPESFGSLTNLFYFNAGNNKMTGTLPKSMGNLAMLQQLMLYNNFLTGSIPDTFGNFPEMLLMILAANRLHGSIPATFQFLTSMEYLDLTNNHLSGSIPSECGNMNDLEILYLFANYLSGPIPSSIALPKRLEEVKLQNNKLSGAIPKSIAEMGTLSTLLLFNNQLSGSVDGIFNRSAQLSLTTVELSNNLLTGALPEELFRLPNILTVVAVSNCFAGALPESLCTAIGIRTVALDGMRSARNCQTRLLPAISSAYQVSYPWHGTLPDCVFSLPQLTTLHLSGNGFVGTIPAALNISATFTGLSLSHNSLVGTIPLSIQTRVWESLDLSYNRLTGTLSADFAASIAEDVVAQNEVAVSLDNNRLSGVIPHTVAQIANVSVLKSNLFMCKLDKSDLPEHDHARSNYQCGSTSFDVPFYTWLILTFIALMVIGLAYQNWRFACNIWYYIVLWYNAHDETMIAYAMYSKHLDVFIRISTKCTIYILLIVAPLCICLSIYNGTVVFQHSYIISAGFIHGRDATALLATAWLVLIVLFGIWFALEIFAMSKDYNSFRYSWLTENKRDFLERAVVYTAFIVINFTFVIGVNAAYVYTVIYADGNILLFVQILLSFFKIFWSRICSGYLVRYISNYISGFQTDAVAQYLKEFMSIQLVISLFNVVAIPCLVVAVVSPRCFNNVFISAPEVRSRYAYVDCTSGFNPTTDSCALVVSTGTTEYDAPFTYSYQCSSTFIAYYAPAFMYMCITATILQPALSLAAYATLKKNYSQTTWWRAWLYKCVPRLWKLPLLENPPFVVRDTFRPVFPANSVTTTTLTYVGILLTFGAVFPPLAVAVLVAIGSTVMTTKLSVGRFVLWATAGSNPNRLSYLSVIELECRDLINVVLFRDAMRIIVIFSCCFYTLFLFDTLGDTEGFGGSIWVLIVFPLFPLMLYPVFYWYKRAQPQVSNRPVSVNPVGVEMKSSTHTQELESTFNVLG